MTDLIKALRAGLELKIRQWEMMPDKSFDFKCGYTEGQGDEHTRLAPILSSLIAVVEAANIHAEWCEFHGSSLELLDAALADLRRAVMPKHEANCRIFRMGGVCTCGAAVGMGEQK